MAQKIGLFGGTFDPVHNGHLAVMRAAMAQFDFALLYVIPAAVPPHKEAQAITPFSHRVAMLRLALGTDPRFHISDIEQSRHGPSYTIDTLEFFSSRLQGDDLYFLIGLDAFAEIATWKEYDRLLERCSFVVIERPGHGCPLISQVVAASFPSYEEESAGCWSSRQGGRIVTLAMEPVAVSSSQVRRRLVRGEGAVGLIPDRVNTYLLEHRLYGHDRRGDQSAGAACRGKAQRGCKSA